MDKEKRKLLLVAISVGVFLVAAIIAAIALSPPGNAAQTEMAGRPWPGSGAAVSVNPPAALQTVPPGAAPDAETPLPSAGVDPVDLVRSPGDVPGLKEPPEGIQEAGDFYVKGSAAPGSEFVITVPKPSTPAVPEKAAAVKAPEPPAKKPASPAAPSKAASAQSKPAAVQSKPAAPVPAAKLYDDFWVQTGAFSTITKAEGVKENLASKGITSIIENRDIEGKTFFRVRVGPYTSQNEADYWLSLIKSISGFEESQIRQSQSRR